MIFVLLILLCNTNVHAVSTLATSSVSFIYDPDDGISPERVAQVMGQLDHCHHAVHIINELVQTAQVFLSSSSLS